MAIYNNETDPNVTQWEQEQMELQSDREKLDIIKANIERLVDYYDDNNIMDTIPDCVWGYILQIEEQSK
jgi:hypothetical protein